MEKRPRHPLAYTYRLVSSDPSGRYIPNFPPPRGDHPPPPEQPGQAWAVRVPEEDELERKPTS